jgi:hypothetical protein
MASRRQGTRTAKQTTKAVGRSASSVSRERYPQWKVELFRAGISERQQSVSGQMGARAMRAPGA